MSGARTLTVGAHRFSGRFVLPLGTPPPTKAAPRIPATRCASPRRSTGGPTPRASFTVHVAAPAPSEPLDATPRVFSTHPGGAPGGEPHVDVSVDSQAVAIGGRIRGAVALHNVENNRYAGVTVALVGYQTRRDERGREVGRARPAHRFGVRLRIGVPTEGISVPFDMRLPADIVPTWHSAFWSVTWALVATAERAWGRDVEVAVPLMLYPAGTVVTRPHYAAPAVGSERVDAIWRGVATELGLAYVEGELFARIGDVQVRVERRVRGAEGPLLVGTLSHPALGLGLAGGRANGFRRIVGGGVSLGDPSWDRAHYLSGREEAQVAAYLVPLRELLRRFRLEALTDTECVLTHRDAGQRGASLRDFVKTLVALAERIPAARDAAPAPAAYANGLEAWEALATRLQTRLSHTDVSLAGRLNGAEVSLTTLFGDDARPLATRLLFRTERPIDAKFTLDHPGETPLDVAISPLPRDAALLVEQLAAVARAVAIEEDALRVDFPAPLADLREVETALRRVARLSRALLGAAGPYPMRPRGLLHRGGASCSAPGMSAFPARSSDRGARSCQSWAFATLVEGPGWLTPEPVHPLLAKPTPEHDPAARNPRTPEGVVSLSHGLPRRPLRPQGPRARAPCRARRDRAAPLVASSACHPGGGPSARARPA